MRVAIVFLSLMVSSVSIASTISLKCDGTSDDLNVVIIQKRDLSLVAKVVVEGPGGSYPTFSYDISDKGPKSVEKVLAFYSGKNFQLTVLNKFDRKGNYQGHVAIRDLKVSENLSCTFFGRPE